MSLTDKKKLSFIETIKTNLSQFSEVKQIVLFGSFVNSKTPNDIDIAIVQNSDKDFLTLSLRYRKVLRELSKIIPLDIVPIKQNVKGSFLQEISKGLIVYER